MTSAASSLQVSAAEDAPAASGRLPGGSEDDAAGGCRYRRGAVYPRQPHLHGEHTHTHTHTCLCTQTNTELFFVVSVSQGHIKGYISHQHQKLVVSKQNPFPPLSAIS